MAGIVLRNLEETRRMGRWLAAHLSGSGVRALLLRGPLGSGKTTLTSALVQALPGGDAAEVASPSFTLCNHYPTTPPVLHCDLYRSTGGLPDEILDGLENPAVLTVVEWAEYLPPADLPEEILDISLQACDESRLITLQAHGSGATALLQSLCAQWPESDG
ncbi:MAG: tRNA (adenosine(37)-N6)-threonylcarbamoyltransferase complex ATPase subunit type 1 TsaE [Desulfovibrio sp.]|uniref:tRNA (adenosine(37)-N6)-threonylcarbamoyltransferase complex ATPase subunit type 1 TsaE n=1 Tax=Desulfovibrio sp. TaxID=885 RepID=UPI00258F7118|nr:tRNA (adenosine(37)-N6)-threonylcarbamoyltransferase complex ATPase subunit type 1 TsaE [Desulfovibrio sp.]MCD7984753.1 tRNA (adenosine(37)-N6)-threonylcarbamoyltransferase complex ATPase subunit type 1 TsaE [Desulfovibrio sp.]